MGHALQVIHRGDAEESKVFFMGLGAILSAEFICGGGYWIGGTSTSSSSSSRILVFSSSIVVYSSIVV